MKIKKTFVINVSTTILFVVIFAVIQTLAQGQTIYNTIPAPLPGNLASQPFQAQQASEFGDRVVFSSGTGRTLTSVTLTMSSWGCQSGAWFSGDCVTAPGATFSHPITLNLYNVGAGNQPGTLIGSVTQTFAIPYRPSADNVNCTGGRWYEASTNTCFNGLAANITFNLIGQNIVVPNQIIFGVTYNTSNYGYSPIGPAPCSATAAGCPYDSLNVALTDPAITLSAGSNPAPDDAYFNTQTAAWYCDGGAGGVNTFRLDQGCWTGFKPSIRFNAANPPTNQNQCKNNGWQTRTRLDGSSFKNQGDCIQYVNTGK